MLYKMLQKPCHYFAGTLIAYTYAGGRMDNTKIDNTKLEQYELNEKDLYWECDESCLGVESTEELEDSMRIIGQERAVEAIEFGMGIDSRGFTAPQFSAGII
jgi:hypothetical protein